MTFSSDSGKIVGNKGLLISKSKNMKKNKLEKQFVICIIFIDNIKPENKMIEKLVMRNF